MRASVFDFTSVMVNAIDGGKQVAVFEDKEHAPMVLMDTIAGTPILAVSVVPSDGKGLMTKRKGDAFQCIFEKDKQSFSFRISNLTRHNVAFYIRSNGKCINKINMVESESSAVIKSDYSNGEREMFLDTLDEKVSVAQDEARADGSAAKGTYFTIEAAPTDQEADWRAAVWLCPEFVCVPVPDAKTSWDIGFAQQPGGWIQNGTAGGWGSGPVTRGTRRPAVQPTFGSDASGRGWGGRPDQGARPAAIACFAGSGSGFGSSTQAAQGGFGGSGAFCFGSGGGFGGGVHAASQPVAAVASQGGHDLALAFAGGPPSPSYGGGDEYDLAEFAAYEDDAFAANVRHGEVKKQGGRAINMEVFFKMGSAAVTLCLSVMKPDKVVQFPPMSENVRLHKMLECIYDFVSGKNARLIAQVKKVHEEKECVICLTEPPQCIFIKCGHCAICNTCKPQLREQKCPLCRGFIVASIQK